MDDIESAYATLVTAADPAMVVVTVAVDGTRSGCLVGFQSQCSIDPVRHAVWLARINHTYGVARRADTMILHFLDESDARVAGVFGSLTTDDDVDKFALVGAGAGDSPVLEQCANRVTARVVAVLDDGTCDHVCFVVEPTDLVSDDSFAPLRYHVVADLEPGHPLGES